MDRLHKLNVEWKESDANEYTLYYSIYINFKKRES